MRKIDILDAYRLSVYIKLTHARAMLLYARPSREQLRGLLLVTR